MPSQYVILHHQLNDSEHWDFMLEQGDVLLTWKLLKDPTDVNNFPIPAQRIQDHRKAYLEYEGPVSGDRGSVSRIDKGTCEILQRTSSQYVFQLDGVHLKGQFSLARENEEWVFKDDI